MNDMTLMLPGTEDSFKAFSDLETFSKVTGLYIFGTP